MQHCTAHSANGNSPNQTIFVKNRWRGGLNVKEPPVAVPIATKWRRIKNGKRGIARWIGYEESSSGAFDSTKCGEYLSPLRYRNIHRMFICSPLRYRNIHRMFLHIKTKVEIKEKISDFFFIEHHCPKTKRPPAGRVEV